MIPSAIDQRAPRPRVPRVEVAPLGRRRALWLAAVCATSLLVAAGGVSCAQPTAPLPRLPQPAAVPMAAAGGDAGRPGASARTLSEIQALVGTAACASDDECRVSPVGANPCGGPEGFIAWSTRTTPDEAALQSLLSRHAAQRRQENEASGRKGMCAVLPVPTARCDNAGPGAGDAAPGRCVLVPQRAGAPTITR